MYKYETHLHTNQGSACGYCTGAEMADWYKSIGYAGIIVTDHYIGGNITTAAHSLVQWDVRVDIFCSGYEDAKRRGDEIGLDVFLGLEYAFLGTEFLVYGVDKAWLKANKQVCELELSRALQCFRDAGALVIHAHPFRRAPWISEHRFVPELTDAVEVYNAQNRDDEWNLQAEKYARGHGLLMISGADSHNAGDKPAGIETREPFKTLKELLIVIKNGDYRIIK